MNTNPTNILATTVLERDIIIRSDSRGEALPLVRRRPLAPNQCCHRRILRVRYVWPTIATSFENIDKALAEYRQDILWMPLDSATHTGMSNFPAYVNTPAI